MRWVTTHLQIRARRLWPTMSIAKTRKSEDGIITSHATLCSDVCWDRKRGQTVQESDDYQYVITFVVYWKWNRNEVSAKFLSRTLRVNESVFLQTTFQTNDKPFNIFTRLHPFVTCYAYLFHSVQKRGTHSTCLLRLRIGNTDFTGKARVAFREFHVA